MRIEPCQVGHLESIRAILNEVIATSTALYDYAPRSAEMVAAWFQAKQQAGHPVLGAMDDDGTLMGFASYGPFRNFPAYKYTVEHSLYVAAPYRRRGVARALLTELIAHARQQDLHVLVGAIDSQNEASIRLHETFGFTRVAYMPQVGFKFGRWLDLVLYQLTLDTPTHPIDG